MKPLLFDDFELGGREVVLRPLTLADAPALAEAAAESRESYSLTSVPDGLEERSRDAIARLGCQFDGLRRAHIPSADGKVRTSAYFSVLAAEWPRVRRDLLSLMTR